MTTEFERRFLNTARSRERERCARDVGPDSGRGGAQGPGTAGRPIAEPFFLVDRERGQLRSKIAESLEEPLSIVVPINSGIASAKWPRPVRP